MIAPAVPRHKRRSVLLADGLPSSVQTDEFEAEVVL